MANLRRLLTMDEVAALTRTPISTLRYWRHLGQGPRSFKLGRRVLYQEDVVLAWIQEQAGVRGSEYVQKDLENRPAG